MPQLHLLSVTWWSNSSWAKSGNSNAGDIEHPTDDTIFVWSFHPCSPYCFCMSQTRFGSCWIRFLHVHSILQYTACGLSNEEKQMEKRENLTIFKDMTRSRRHYHVSWILCDILNHWSTLTYMNFSQGCLRWCILFPEEPDGSCLKWTVTTLRKGKWVERPKHSFFYPLLHLRVGELHTVLQSALATQLLLKKVWNMATIKWFSGNIPF